MVPLEHSKFIISFLYTHPYYFLFQLCIFSLKRVVQCQKTHLMLFSTCKEGLNFQNCRLLKVSFSWIERWRSNFLSSFFFFIFFFPFPLSFLPSLVHFYFYFFSPSPVLLSSIFLFPICCIILVIIVVSLIHILIMKLWHSTGNWESRNEQNTIPAFLVFMIQWEKEIRNYIVIVECSRCYDEERSALWDYKRSVCGSGSESVRSPWKSFFLFVLFFILFYFF